MSLSPRLNKGIGTYRFPLRLAQETETRHDLPAWPIPPASEAHVSGCFVESSPPSSALCTSVPMEVLPICLPRCLRVSQVISKFLPKKEKRFIFIDFLNMRVGGGLKR